MKKLFFSSVISASLALFGSLKDEFPLGVYWAWPHNANNAAAAGLDIDTYLDKSMATLRDLNCDSIWIVNGPYGESEKFLDLCQKYNIKAVLPTVFVEMYYQPFFGNLERYEKFAKDTVEGIGKKDALMGYVLKDEPRLNSLQQTDYFHQLLKRTDPKHRDSLVVVITSDIQTYIEDTSLPVLCTDVYLFGGYRSTVMPNTTEASQELYRSTCENAVAGARRSGKHLWIMPQYFTEVWGWTYFDENKRRWMEKDSYVHWRTPTVNEARWQTWEAVRCGAKGVVFFLANVKEELTKADIAPGTKVYEKKKKYFDMMLGQSFLKDRSNFETELTEIPREQALMYLGGKPTPAFEAIGKAYGKIAKAKGLLLKSEKAPYPAFFFTNPAFHSATFSVPNSTDLIGVIVNDDLNKKRTCRVYMTDCVESVKEIGGRDFELSSPKKNLRYFDLTLEPGDGVIVSAKFKNNRSGMQLMHEDFMRHLFKGRIADFVETRPNIACNNRGVGDLVYKKDATPSNKAAFTIANLTNSKTANNTFFLNVNSKKKDGNVWLYFDGKDVSVRAVRDVNAKELKTDIAHVEALGSKEKSEESSAGLVNLKFIPGMPTELPVGTTGLEFVLNSQDSYLREVYIWFSPLVK